MQNEFPIRCPPLVLWGESFWPRHQTGAGTICRTFIPGAIGIRSQEGTSTHKELAETADVSAQLLRRDGRARVSRPGLPGQLYPPMRDLTGAR
jgi:hypothetical protein